MFDPDAARDFAVDTVRRLTRAGYVALFAGGCVRDELLGQVPKDFDVATDARPEAVRAVFGPRRTLAIGAAFGVVERIGGPVTGHVQIATFRSDGTYSDGRRPDSVVFSSPREDALRRDFTINGMFLDPTTGEVLDFVGGRDDLAAGVIRAIGSPRDRIAEDKLRMLRAPRFAARYGFALDGATADAIREDPAGLGQVSPERIADEMRKMLAHPSRTAAVAGDGCIGARRSSARARRRRCSRPSSRVSGEITARQLVDQLHLRRGERRRGRGLSGRRPRDR